MKRVILILVILLFIAAAVAAWIFLGPATGFSTPKETLYIRTQAANKKAILDSLKANHIITNENAFEFLANRLDYWQNIHPGKYEIKKGTSLLTLVRTLRNGRQTPMNLVITKLRTKEDFAKLVGRKFECDSAQMMDFLNNSDSMRQFNAEPETALWNVLPETYTYHWNTTPGVIYRKLYNESEKFWNQERKAKAQQQGLSPLQAYILASIVEEETTNNKEKDTIASVYLNRLHQGMPLQADPTLKFAVKDFSIKWIHGDMLKTQSPYNTYQNKGLPPGPICTPSKITIDAVLNAATTSYLYFVANSKLNGHLFSTTFEEHTKKAAEYREEDKKRREEQEQKATK